MYSKGQFEYDKRIIIHGREVLSGPIYDDIDPPRKYNFPARRLYTAKDRLNMINVLP